MKSEAGGIQADGCWCQPQAVGAGYVKNWHPVFISLIPLVLHHIRRFCSPDKKTDTVHRSCF